MDDDLACRHGFLDLERSYLRIDDDPAAELEDMYRSILRRKGRNDVQLVDNFDFLVWAATYGDG